MNISCEIIRDLLPLYHDDVCSKESKEMVEEHLSGCENCKAELEAMDTMLPVANIERNLKEADAVQKLSKRWKKVHGYEVQESIVFENDRGFALAENPNAPQPFVTWQLTENEDGSRDYYWGHYSSDKDTAVKDFHGRVDEYRRDYGYAEKGTYVQPQQPDNYLKSAEMNVEQNLDMIDGIINNEPPSAPDLTDGQTFDEIQELAPETMREGKPSIKEQLRDCADAVKAADAIPKPPKQSGLELE